jgi:alpha-amylase
LSLQRPAPGTIKTSLPTALLATVLQFASTALSADTASWKSRNIYFALTDRVARSSSDSGGGSCGNLGNYCGGTFAGIQSKLDYIQGMGFDAIWLTPVVASKFPWLEWNLCIGVVANVVLLLDTPGGYHGYWASNLSAINPNYGTAQDLKNLVTAAHQKVSIHNHSLVLEETNIPRAYM